MNLYVLANVDYDEFSIVGIFDSVEKAKAAASVRPIQGRSYFIENYRLNDAEGRTFPYLVSKDRKTWNSRG